MKTKSIFLLFAMLLAITACNKNSQCTKDQALIDSLLTALDNAYNSGDVDKFMSLYANDVLVMSVGANYTSKDSLTAHIKPLISFYKNVHYSKGISAVRDNQVTYTGMFSLDWAMEATPAPVRGVANIVWQKQVDNSWKIIMGNLNFAMLAKK